MQCTGVSGKLHAPAPLSPEKAAQLPVGQGAERACFVVHVSLVFSAYRRRTAWHAVNQLMAPAFVCMPWSVHNVRRNERYFRTKCSCVIAAQDKAPHHVFGGWSPVSRRDSPVQVEYLVVLAALTHSFCRTHDFIDVSLRCSTFKAVYMAAETVEIN